MTLRVFIFFLISFLCDDVLLFWEELLHFSLHWTALFYKVYVRRGKEMIKALFLSFHTRGLLYVYVCSKTYLFQQSLIKVNSRRGDNTWNWIMFCLIMIAIVINEISYDIDSCAPNWSSIDKFSLFYNWYLMTLGFFVPTTILIVSNVLVFHKSRKVL